MSDIRLNRGLNTQLINNSSYINPDNWYSNYASTYELFNFTGQDLFFNNHYDSYSPKKIVLNLREHVVDDINNNNDNDNVDEIFSTLFRLLDSVFIRFKIGAQIILQVPFLLLWQLKEPVINEGSIYIDFPFKSFLRKIDMGALSNSDVCFTIVNHIMILDYVSSFSMVCKVTVYDFVERRRMLSETFIGAEQIQQLSTITVYHENPDNLPDNDTTNIFQLQLSSFNGMTRGVFIGCSVNELREIKFYINNVLRINYNSYFIKEYCVNISDNLLYLPFNNNSNFCDMVGFQGAINFSNLNSAILKLSFSTGQRKVWVSNLYSNKIQYRLNYSFLTNDYPPLFIVSTTINHPVIPIIEPSHNVNMFDMSGNIIANLGNYNFNRHNHYVNSFNFSDNNLAVSQTTPATPTTVTEGTTNTTGNIYSVNEQNNYVFETNEPINRLITNDRIVCNISQEDIIAGELYMSCNNCMNHFKKTALMLWLSRNNYSRRTCPTCRTHWNNHNVYINTE
jgi:hypothetical protein